MNYDEESLRIHKEHKGKLEVVSVIPVDTTDDLSIAYTPGVAEPCRKIAEDKSLAYDLTIKGRSVAVVTDGSSVLGLGNIGPEAALPVMEGKALLFKRFANIDAYPICLATQDVEEIIKTVKHIAPGFGGINLEDISAPRCFEIEERLRNELDIPVMHDDQHGTATVVLAGLINALKVVQKDMKQIKVVISGAGAGGMAIANLLLEAGVKDMQMLDSKGVIISGRERMNKYKETLAKLINPKKACCDLCDVIKGADVFIGVSQPEILDQDMVRSMNKDAIIFALSNPIPEIMPNLAKEAGAAVVATGRSDFPNQVNNSLAFPGLFRGALDARIKQFTKPMFVRAAHALANLVEKPTAEQIIPLPFDERILETISKSILDE